ncbi:MAG: arginine deiminase family protein [Gemmatimonadales bacterium]
MWSTKSCPRRGRGGLEVYRTPGSELVKGRGGPRCMTRPIYRLPA